MGVSTSERVGIAWSLAPGFSRLYQQQQPANARVTDRSTRDRNRKNVGCHCPNDPSVEKSIAKMSTSWLDIVQMTGPELCFTSSGPVTICDVDSTTRTKSTAYEFPCAESLNR